MSVRDQLSPERPVRLRRIAQWIEERAERSESPAKARVLARQMRLRASELEAGKQLRDDEETARLLAEMAEEPEK